MSEAEKLIAEFNLPGERKLLAPGDYTGILQHNEAGYFIKARGPDGQVINMPVSLRTHVI